jgi:mannose-6-phosphate isomerase
MSQPEKNADTSPLYDERPWGLFQVLEEGEGYKVKRIEVLPGKRLSYQRHAQRAEHWVVIHGTARVTLDDKQIDVPAGEAIDIAIGAAHRVENAGAEQLIFIEVQRGDYLGEDDITRLSDDYGRAGEK